MIQPFELSMLAPKSSELRSNVMYTGFWSLRSWLKPEL